MEIDEIIQEAEDMANIHGLGFVEIDRTDNIVSVKLHIDSQIFIQIYGNSSKNKLNMALVFNNRRLYGYDSSGGRYHYHPFDAPDAHIFTDERKSIRDFVQESLKLLDESEVL